MEMIDAIYQGSKLDHWLRIPEAIPLDSLAVNFDPLDTCALSDHDHVWCRPLIDVDQLNGHRHRSCPAAIWHHGQ